MENNPFIKGSSRYNPEERKNSNSRSSDNSSLVYDRGDSIDGKSFVTSNSIFTYASSGSLRGNPRSASEKTIRNKVDSIDRISENTLNMRNKVSLYLPIFLSYADFFNVSPKEYNEDYIKEFTSWETILGKIADPEKYGPYIAFCKYKILNYFYKEDLGFESIEVTDILNMIHFTINDIDNLSIFYDSLGGIEEYKQKLKLLAINLDSILNETDKLEQSFTSNHILTLVKKAEEKLKELINCNEHEIINNCKNLKPELIFALSSIVNYQYNYLESFLQDTPGFANYDKINKYLTNLKKACDDHISSCKKATSVIEASPVKGLESFYNYGKSPAKEKGNLQIDSDTLIEVAENISKKFEEALNHIKALNSKQKTIKKIDDLSTILPFTIFLNMYNNFCEKGSNNDFTSRPFFTPYTTKKNPIPIPIPIPYTAVKLTDSSSSNDESTAKFITAEIYTRIYQVIDEMQEYAILHRKLTNSKSLTRKERDEHDDSLDKIQTQIIKKLSFETQSGFFSEVIFSIFYKSHLTNGLSKDQNTNSLLINNFSIFIEKIRNATKKNERKDFDSQSINSMNTNIARTNDLFIQYIMFNVSEIDSFSTFIATNLNQIDSRLRELSKKSSYAKDRFKYKIIILNEEIEIHSILFNKLSDVQETFKFCISKSDFHETFNKLQSALQANKIDHKVLLNSIKYTYTQHNTTNRVSNFLNNVVDSQIERKLQKVENSMDSSEIAPLSNKFFTLILQSMSKNLYGKDEYEIPKHLYYHRVSGLTAGATLLLIAYQNYLSRYSDQQEQFKSYLNTQGEAITQSSAAIDKQRKQSIATFNKIIDSKNETDRNFFCKIPGFCREQKSKQALLLSELKNINANQSAIHDDNNENQCPSFDNISLLTGVSSLFNFALDLRSTIIVGCFATLASYAYHEVKYQTTKHNRAERFVLDFIGFYNKLLSDFDDIEDKKNIEKTINDNISNITAVVFLIYIRTETIRMNDINSTNFNNLKDNFEKLVYSEIGQNKANNSFALKVLEGINNDSFREFCTSIEKQINEDKNLQSTPESGSYFGSITKVFSSSFGL